MSAASIIAALAAALAVAVLLGRPAVGSSRLVVRRRAAETSHRGGLSSTAACAVAGIALALLVGLPAGVVVGGLVSFGAPPLLARLEPGAVRREREQFVTELPLVLDLLAACLSGGSTLTGAAAAVARAIPGPCSARLTAVVGALAVGSPPAEAWWALAGGQADDPLASAARLLGRAAEGGAPVAATVGRLAAEARATSRAAGAEAARRVGVLVVAPLGLCFLPAFVLLGVVPVVIGLAGPLLASF